MQLLDAAYFQVGEARETLLSTFIGDESAAIETFREGFRRNGPDIDRPEAESRFV